MASAPAGPPPLAIRLLMRSFQVAGLLMVTVIVLAVVTTIWWRFTPTNELDLLVYDQTVADDRYPDHAVLEQLLEYHRVPFDASQDYVGAAPGGGPHGVWPEEQPDAIFLADLYGLYANDEGQLDEFGRNRITDRLTAPQADDVATWVAAGTPAYAEFGLVTEPTAQDAGLVLQEVFGFVDTGWALKPYDDLRDVSPQIQQLGPSPWPYDGPGWIVVGIATPATATTAASDDETIGTLFVLPGSLIEERLPLVVGGPPGSAGGSAPFGRWIGIVEPAEDAIVDAWIELRVTEEGARQLTKAGVPLRFPALIRTENTLYFAGDGLDDETPFRLRRLTGGATFTRLVTGNEFRFLYQVLEPSIGWMLDRVDEESVERVGADATS